LFMPAIPVCAGELGATASAAFALTLRGRFGFMYAADIEWALSNHLSIGSRVEQFNADSLSSDGMVYDGDYMDGRAAGAQVRYRFRPNKTIDPYASGRLQLMWGTRGPGDISPASDHVTLAPGLELGVDFWIGQFRIGVFYALDVPLADYNEFGGARVNYLIPALRIGVSF